MIRNITRSPVALTVMAMIMGITAWNLLTPPEPSQTPDPKWPRMSPIADDEKKSLANDEGASTPPRRSKPPRTSGMERLQLPPTPPPSRPKPTLPSRPQPSSKPAAPKPPIVHFLRETPPQPDAATNPPVEDRPSQNTKTDDASRHLIGEIIRCQLISGLISGHENMPILAIVTHDVVTAQGVLALPRGTELLGSAQATRTKDRIQATGQWLATLPGGRKQNVQATALHHDQDRLTRAYGTQDMTPGIKGTLTETDDLRAYKEIAAAAMSAASRATQDTTRNLFGNQRTQSLGNLARDGVDAVADRYLRRLESQIEDDGKVVTVPAGTRFYLIIQPSNSRPNN